MANHGAFGLPGPRRVDVDAPPAVAQILWPTAGSVDFSAGDPGLRLFNPSGNIPGTGQHGAASDSILQWAGMTPNTWSAWTRVTHASQIDRPCRLVDVTGYAIVGGSTVMGAHLEFAAGDSSAPRRTIGQVYTAASSGSPVGGPSWLHPAMAIGPSECIWVRGSKLSAGGTNALQVSVQVTLGEGYGLASTKRLWLPSGPVTVASGAGPGVAGGTYTVNVSANGGLTLLTEPVPARLRVTHMLLVGPTVPGFLALPEGKQLHLSRSANSSLIVVPVPPFFAKSADGITAVFTHREPTTTNASVSIHGVIGEPA